LIAKEEKKWKDVTLNVTMFEVNSMMFAHGRGVGDIVIWHK
jgi:hypothetical protein